MNENENNKYDNNEYNTGGNNMNEINSSGSNNNEYNEYNEYNNTNDPNRSTFNNMNNIGNSFNNSSPINNNMNNNMNSNYIPNFIMGEQIKTEHIREQQINEEKKRRLEEKRAKRKKFAVSFAASMAAIAVCGAGIGMGVSLGNGMMNKAGIGNNSVKDFSFNEDTIIVPNTAENTELMSTNTIAPIIKNVKDAVVNINIIVERRDFFNQAYQNTGSGSGIIYKEDAEKVYIITNNHVVDGANKVTISITGDEQISASLVGKDAQSDLAVIYVLKSDLEKAGIHEVSVAKFADSSYIEVGEYVIAIGNALGAGKTVTQGIISAQNKNITIDGKKLTVLQTDAAINPGNSGGALVNTDGEVIGINTAKISSTTIEGMGYAIPSSIAVSIANELITNGSIERPYLGVEVFTITDAFKSMYNIDINGVFIRAVTSGSTAEEAGLRSTDIITGFNGQEITTVDDLSEAINNCQANQEVTLSIIRNGVEPMNIVVRLAAAEKNF